MTTRKATHVTVTVSITTFIRDDDSYRSYNRDHEGEVEVELRDLPLTATGAIDFGKLVKGLIDQAQEKTATLAAQAAPVAD